MPRPPHPPKGGKKKNKQLLMVGGGAAAAVVVFALIKRQSSGSGADTTAATTGATPTYDSTANDVYNSLEDQLGQLQQSIAAIASQGATNGSTGTGTGSGTGTSGSGSTSSGGSVLHPGSGGPVAKPPTSGSGSRVISGGSPPRGVPKLSTVTVSHGQTLSGIASAHHETLATLLKDNPVYTTNPKYKKGNLIFAGDKVKVR